MDIQSDILNTLRTVVKRPRTLAYIALVLLFIANHGVELTKGKLLEHCLSKQNVGTAFCTFISKYPKKFIGMLILFPAILDLNRDLIFPVGLFALLAIYFTTALAWHFYFLAALALHTFFGARLAETRILIVAAIVALWYFEILAFS